MTYAPASLLKLAAYWKDQGGVSLGIVGDTDHATRGVSYHLGKDQLRPDAYSIQTARDKIGLTNAASAIDLGRLNGGFADLRAFSDWLARRCVKNVSGTRDVREVIYSPDGKRVLGFKDGVDYLIPDYGDTGHLTHTHISFYRDSQDRDKTALFEPYFGPEAPPMIAISYLRGARAGNVTVKGSGHTYLNLTTGAAIAIPAGKQKRAFGPVKLVGRGISGPNDPRQDGYMIGPDVDDDLPGGAAFMITADVVFIPDPAATPVVLTVGGTKVFEASV